MLYSSWFFSFRSGCDHCLILPRWATWRWGTDRSFRILVLLRYRRRSLLHSHWYCWRNAEDEIWIYSLHIWGHRNCVELTVEHILYRLTLRTYMTYGRYGITLWCFLNESDIFYLVLYHRFYIWFVDHCYRIDCCFIFIYFYEVFRLCLVM